MEAVVLQTCFEAEFLVAFETQVTHNFLHNLLNVEHPQEKVLVYIPAVHMQVKEHDKPVLDGIRDSCGDQYRCWWGQGQPTSKGQSYSSVRQLPPVIRWDIKYSIKHIQGYPDLFP